MTEADHPEATESSSQKATIEKCLEIDPNTISSQDPTVKPICGIIERLRAAGATDDYILGLLIGGHCDLNNNSPAGAIGTEPDVVEGIVEDFIENGCHAGEFAI